ncbi:TonB-dependent receptor [Sphingomonas sp. SORGH_AS_0789]|uniref:TonB-dependent receptor n=2 Tax=unclassified Sphingomonas TaxID=196159 RepID=UPI002855D692|nr:TonB-dependent receptor [Sphingomonas sp. SORGH_AS_0789]MDR6116429.1 iron complex outermembrane receptor protein [Sphingomonas sp. SORGH_AS_0789]MDR6149896.1 iron complex outermembrane receptor protein [Sphingomonas sp. SORGH_AS_0742]
MRDLQSRWLIGASMAALAISGFSGGAQAQTGDATPMQGGGLRVEAGRDPTKPTGALNATQVAQGVSDQDIVVTGVRESLRSAQALKRNANQIVDSVQAQDIGKLPDANTTEALQRITGVQIQRRYGEGATDFDHRTSPAITVRGLTQVQNFLDGRAIYSASGGRAFDLEGIPPELLAGIDVYKNAPANIIEGGVGAAVNLRTRLPFDKPGQTISGTIRGNYYDRADKFGYSTSGLYSNRFDTGIGEIGFLVNAVYSTSYYRQDGILANPQQPIPAGSIAGAPANAKAPMGMQVYDDLGDRRRLGVATAIQWRAADNLLITGQYQLAKYWFNRRGAYFYTVNGGSQSSPLPGSNFTFNKDGYATSGSLQGQNFESGRFDQQLWSQSQNFTLGADWQATDRAKVHFDVQYLKSYYNADRNGHVLTLFTATGQNTTTGSPHPSTIDFDLRGSRPQWDVRDKALLTNPANYATPYIADALQRNDADTLALAYDIDYDLEGGFLQKLRGGARYSDNSINLRGTWNGVCLYATGPDPSCSAPDGTALIPLSRNPQLAMQGPSKNFFDGRTVTGGLLYPAFPAGDGVWAQTKALYALFGAKTKDAFTPGDLNAQTEKTYTVWGAGDFAFTAGGVRFDGGAGVRLVKTDLTSFGTQFNSNGTTSPLAVQKSYIRALPSVNIRARLTDEFQMRLAYSKGLARPNFDQLSTNLTLNNPNQVNPITGRPSASSGNPRLNPISSDNFDLTAEWYFAPTGSLIGGLFYKKVDGFLASGVVVQNFQGRAYDVSTVLNSGKGTIKGAEIGYQQFFDFLPGLLSGFGVQANYTYVDSNVTNPFAVAGSGMSTQLPLEKLSKHNYNLIGLYEKGPLTARLAYNWRSSYLDQTFGAGTNQPQYAKPYASLDASVSVNVNSHIALSADAVNLTNRMNVTYIGTIGQPLQYQLNDRRFGLSLRATY